MLVSARSISNDKKAGIPVTRQEYPVGMAGVKLSLTEIAKRIREGSRTPSIRSMAGHIIQQAGAGMDVRQRGQAILDYVREKVVYAYDPEMTEMTASAPILLCVEGAPLCMPIGDCFPAGTLLLRGDGDLVPVESIRAGEKIWGRDDWSIVEAVVFKGPLSVDAIHLSNGAKLCLTEGHKVYAWYGESVERITVGQLEAGARLLQPVQARGVNPRASEVLTVEKIDRDVATVPCVDIQTSDHYVYLPEHDVTVSICDDACVAIGSLMGAAGMTVRVAKLVISEGAQEHVLIEVYDDSSGEWLGADFSEFNSSNYPLGWEPPHESKQTMDPMHPDVTRISGWGKHEAEFIGVGSARGGRMAAGELRWDIFNHRWIGSHAAPVGLGAAGDVTNIPADPYAKAQTDLANQVAAVVHAGDVYFSANPPEYAQAISAYQAAGAAGATSVGPEIDAAGNSSVTQPLTQQAWLINRSLALLSSTGANADAAEATTAQSQAKQMVALYNQAINAGRTAKPPVPGETQAASAGSAIGGILVVGAAAGITWSLLRSQRHARRRR